jgi:predicted Zn-dependent peptidase
MHRLCDEDLTEDELHRAKEFTKGRLRLDLETTNGVAFWLTYQELLIGEIKDIEDELRMVDEVGVADIRRVANSVLRSPLQMAVIGPFSRESVFRAAIES